MSCGSGHVRADKVVPVLTPFTLEVRTEQFYEVLHALERAGFEVAAKPGVSSRYVVRDQQTERGIEL